jgi:hypothetical protein
MIPLQVSFPVPACPKKLKKQSLNWIRRIPTSGNFSRSCVTSERRNVRMKPSATCVVCCLSSRLLTKLCNCGRRSE